MFNLHLTGHRDGRTGRLLNHIRAFGFIIVSVAVAIVPVVLSGCDNGSGKSEYAYVTAAEASLRDRVAAVYNKTGQVHNGERLQVLERMQNRRFVRVRTSRGEEGWLQERYLTDQQTFDELQRMAQQYKDSPGQGTATVEHQANIHVRAGRKTEHLYVLDEKQKVVLLERRTVDRNAAPESIHDEKTKDSGSSPDDNSEDTTPAASSQQPTIWDDWWLVRDQQQRVGWVLGRALYLDVPEDVAQYAEGQRIVAAFPLDEVQDENEGKKGEYLVLLTEPKDGMPYDFNQVRVFTWNMRRHRYETAYRERNVEGSLPVVLGSQAFEKEGTLRTFTLHVKDAGGAPREQMYKFNPPIVRKVYAPGQEPVKTRKAPRKHSGA